MRDFKVALALHHIKHIVEISESIPDDTSQVIHGRSTGLMRIGPPVVTLLSEDSTPDFQRLAEDAFEDFESAKSELLENGTEFYTELRPNWATPVVHWTINI